MSTHPSLDPESFEKLLADAYVVRESGIGPLSLSSLVELQRMVATGDLNPDRAMALIAERARSVAGASGVALAVLRGDQLFYRAGSGSLAPLVGRQVTAILNVSRNKQSTDEILRVQDADNDGRIEAAICRQFSSRSLLILPIYAAGPVVGVLEIVFTEAHAFLHGEVLTYRLMTGLLGEAMSRALQRNQNQKKTVPPARPVVQRIQKETPPQAPLVPSGSEFKPEQTSRPATVQLCRTPAVVPESPRQRQWAASTSAIRAKRMSPYKCWVGAMVLVVLATWIVYRDRHPVPTLGLSATQRSNTIERPVASAPEKRATANITDQPALKQPDLKKDASMAAKSTPRSEPVGNHELDDVAQDVTVRHFNTKPAPQRVEFGGSRVRYIGDDVTVRYFTPQPSLSRDGSSRIHYISDDVTVRSFTSQHAPAPAPLPTGSAPQSVDR